MSSGVKIDPAAELAINNMISKKGERMKVIVLVINGAKTDIIVDEARSRTVSDFKAGDNVFKEVMDLLEDHMCCYCVYDCFYVTKEGSEKEELVMISWCPGTAKIKDKMLYSASWKALNAKFSGIKHHWQLCDPGDKCQDDLTDKLGMKGCVAKLEGKCCLPDQYHK